MAMAQMNREPVTATDYPAEQLLSETDIQEQLPEKNDSQEELLDATDPPEELLDKTDPTEELLDKTDPPEELLDKADTMGKPHSLEQLQEVCQVLQDANCEEGLSRQMLRGVFDVVDSKYAAGAFDVVDSKYAAGDFNVADSKYAAGAFDIQAVPKGVWMFRPCRRVCGCSGCA